MDLSILQSIPGTNLYQKKFQSCYQDLLDFCNVTNLHLEPSLKTLSSDIYHTSNVLHTRIVDTNPLSETLRSNLSTDELKAFNRLRNQDAIKQEWQLDLAERYHLKACGFVHAMVPSIYIQIPKVQNYAKQMKLKNQLKLEKDTIKKEDIKLALENLKNEYVGAHFNSAHFLHTRFWFFDLDYSELVAQESLFHMMEEVGLTEYVNAIVQTSPTKYHFYLKSEMIATKLQVQNWPTALPIKDLEKAVDPSYLKTLLKKHPRYTGSDWFDVAKRGLPSFSRLGDIPIPIPEEAKLVGGVYYGDDDVYNSYQDSWHKIAQFLGADPSTNDSMRLAQLPGYSNPKNLYQAHLIYQNKEAKVLTTKIARNLIIPSIEKYTKNHNNESFYESVQKASKDTDGYVRLRISKSDLSSNGNRFTKGLDALKEIDKEIDKKVRRKKAKDKYKKKKKAEKAKLSKKKRYIKLRNLPNSPEDYCRKHGLLDDVIWEKNIVGHSNAMFLLLCRHVKQYIVLSNLEQQRIYFDRIIRPYLQNRISKDIARDKNLVEFFSRFQSICKSGLRDLQNYLNSRNKISAVKKGIDVSNVKILFEQTIADKIGRTNEVFKQKGHEKIRNLIYDNIQRSGFVSTNTDGIEINFYIPKDIMVKTIGGRYRNLLRVYENIGVYYVDTKYKCPTVDDYGNVYKKGKCKKHTMYLKDCEMDHVYNPIGKAIKKRLSKKEQKAEDLTLLQKAMFKKKGMML